MVIMIPAKILTLGGEWNKRMDRVRSRARSSMGSRARRILMEGIDSRGIFQNRRSQGDIHTPGEALPDLVSLGSELPRIPDILPQEVCFVIVAT